MFVHHLQSFPFPPPPFFPDGKVAAKNGILIRQIERVAIPLSNTICYKWEFYNQIPTALYLCVNMP